MSLKNLSCAEIVSYDNDMNMNLSIYQYYVSMQENS